MAKHYVSSDPTAHQAVANVMRQQDRRPRRFLAEFPDIFNSLMPHEAKALLVKAVSYAGGDLHAVTRDHLEQAKGE